jgi:hypothetical protein
VAACRAPGKSSGATWRDRAIHDLLVCGEYKGCLSAGKHAEHFNHKDTGMTEADRAAVDDALQINPVAMAEAEGHLQKGLMMLTNRSGSPAPQASSRAFSPACKTRCR